MARAVIVLAEGYEEIEAITPIDLLRRADIEVTIAGLNSLLMYGSHGIGTHCDTLLENLSDDLFDAVILPGGMPGTTNLLASPRVTALLKRHAQAGKICSALCAAPRVLAQAGLLSNRQFTCYPGVENHLSSGIYCGGLCVVDGPIITGESVGATQCFSLSLIAQLRGEKVADEVSEKICAKTPYICA